MRWKYLAFAAACGAFAYAAAPAAAQEFGNDSPAYFFEHANIVGDGRPEAAAIPRETVAYNGPYAPGTILISTEERRLYYILPDHAAIRYGVGVGRPGFEWGGAQTVSTKREWPSWTPPVEMLKRRPDLPRHMVGGPENPLGARAMYLGSSLYRIHGSNEPDTIGQAVSSGCIRMTNEDVVDLYERVRVGTKVVVLPKTSKRPLDAYAAMPRQQISVTVKGQPLARNNATTGIY
jgi:lipoprotein-anchoring transpeptidase ErfK/SrfK